MESSGANWEMRHTWDSGHGGLARETSDLGRLVWDDLSLDPFEGPMHAEWDHLFPAASSSKTQVTSPPLRRAPQTGTWKPTSPSGACQGPVISLMASSHSAAPFHDSCSPNVPFRLTDEAPRGDRMMQRTLPCTPTPPGYLQHCPPRSQGYRAAADLSAFKSCAGGPTAPAAAQPLPGTQKGDACSSGEPSTTHVHLDPLRWAPSQPVLGHLDLLDARLEQAAQQHAPELAAPVLSIPYVEAPLQRGLSDLVNMDLLAGLEGPEDEVLDEIWPPHTPLDLDAMLPATPFAAAMRLNEKLERAPTESSTGPEPLHDGAEDEAAADALHISRSGPLPMTRQPSPAAWSPAVMLPPGRSLSCKLPAMSCPGSGQCTPTTGSIPALHGSAPPFATLSHSGMSEGHRSKRLQLKSSSSTGHESAMTSRKSGSAAIDKRAGRKRLAVDHINLELLQEHGYFDMPIQEAAQQLKVGLSVLKRICRQMGLARWPYRTRQSLRGVIAKTQQYYRGEETGEGVQKAHVMQALQSTLENLQGVPGQGLSESVRKYRQSVFKLNYKIKKRRGEPGEGDSPAEAAAKQLPMPIIPNTAAARIATSACDQPSSPGLHADVKEEELLEGLLDLPPDALAEPEFDALRGMLGMTGGGLATPSWPMLEDDENRHQQLR